jgi:16S rRNA (cytosine967-C5)-methyltransferase
MLDLELAPLARHGWNRVPDHLKDILRIGAYQLRVLDRVPPHAAVSTSVTIAREVGGNKASGFVNAVLRSVARTPEFSSPVPVDLSTRYSHPEWLVERWLEKFGQTETESLLKWNNRRPQLVLQPARMPARDIRRALDQAGIASRDAPYEMGLVVERGAPTSLPGYREGAFFIQDAAQALVSRFAAPETGADIYDACASPGGKTIVLEQEARIVVAADHRSKRMTRLVENLERAGTGRARVIVADAAAPPLRALDLVLIDAPCTGTGTFARHPDARHRLQPGDITRLELEQKRILDGAKTAVRQGGLLVYATCSLEPEENEQQVQRFLEENEDFQREPPGDFPPELLSPLGDLVLLPHRHGTDGAYAARLRRAES